MLLPISIIRKTYQHFKSPIIRAKIYWFFLISFMFSIIYTFMGNDDFVGGDDYKKMINEKIDKIVKRIEQREHGKHSTEDVQEITEETLDVYHEKNVSVLYKFMSPGWAEFFTKFVNRLFFSISTAGTVGYDMYPRTVFAKILVAIQIILTVTMLAA